MQRCPELRKLPKAPKISSILWKYQNPGSAAQLIFYSRSSQPLDPTHPAANWNPRGLPQHITNGLQLRAIPVALLDTPQHSFSPFKRPFVTWNERVQKAMDAGVMGVQAGRQLNIVWKQTGQLVGNTQIYSEDDQDLLRRTRLEGRDLNPASPLFSAKLQRAKRRVPMSLFIVTSKAKMGSLRCRRKTIASRVKTALNYIVSRGAYFEQSSKSSHDNADAHKAANSSTEKKARSRPTGVKFDSSKLAPGRQLVLQGWSYIIHLTTEVYRMPYAQLIFLLRNALSTVNAKAIEMENNWLAQSLLYKQRQVSQKLKSGTELSKSGWSAPLSATSTDERAGEPDSEPRAPCTPIPPSHATKTRSTFDSAAWRRNLTSQLKLLSEAEATVAAERN
ncbi:hypothetical protein CPB83DRAFT_862324 [Crepidotus variabilis]|uniref:Uncharacterized protein n=1 Tax=Crepidotus variabilis TaxID=179855 RepID=A0A9P6E7B3_9AGAR|nr:hypothetical protein CPB83DRAFT_862324 [Crepidotus variabilis]